jgi:hypothetical protein
MNRTKWFDRKFDFNITENILPIILERLKGTPLRLTDKIKHTPSNLKPEADLLNEFYEIRTKTLSMLVNLDEELIFKSSLHPRLKTPMRTLDLFLFVAEHDDHHLPRMTEMEKWLRNSN